MENNLVFFPKKEFNRKIKTDQLVLKKVFENMNEGVLITNCNEEIIYVNPQFRIVTGYSLEEVRGKSPRILQSGIHKKAYYEEMWREICDEGCWQGEIWNKRKNGEVYPEWISIYTITNEINHVSYYIALFSDISEKKRTEEQLHELAYFDNLTGIFNRSALNKRFSKILKAAIQTDRHMAVIFLDLDRFHIINDTLGHAYGDELLKQVSIRLKELLHKRDVIARLGGDEFVIILPLIKNRQEAIKLAETIIESLNDPFFIYKEEVFISTSIGISFFPDDGDDIDLLLRNADKALYCAKLAGRNTFKIYESTMHKSEKRQLLVENCLRKAIDRQEFYLMFQPIVDMRSKKVVSVEALIRWNQEELGFVSPAEFIPIAEETGLIIPISDWVIEEACEQLNRMHVNGFPHLKMSINISAAQFNKEDFVESIASVFQRTNVKRHCITLELTESMIMSNEQLVINKLVKLKQLGIKLAVDDFGTGYSSLSYLHRFPIDILKIDRSFIKHLIDYKEDAAIVKAIITIANTLHLKVVAEGVESKKQFELLEKENCTKVQGFYISKPLDFEDLIEFLGEWDQELFSF